MDYSDNFNHDKIFLEYFGVKAGKKESLSNKNSMNLLREIEIC